MLGQVGILLLHGPHHALQLVAAAGGDFFGPQRIATQHVARSRVGRHLGQRGVEQAQLQHALPQQRLDLRLRDRRDVVKSLGRQALDLRRL